MAEGRVAQIMGERQGLGQVLIQPQRPGDRAGHLGHLDGVGEPRPVVVALVIHKDLGLVLQAPEGLGVDDPVTVAGEGGAEIWPALGMDPAAGLLGKGGIGSREPLHGRIR